jgi:hypothetical protein
MTCEGDEETEAVAIPATTMLRAAIRRVSFIAIFSWLKILVKLSRLDIWALF